MGLLAKSRYLCEALSPKLYELFVFLKHYSQYHLNLECLQVR